MSEIRVRIEFEKEGENSFKDMEVENYRTTSLPMDYLCTAAER